MNNFEMKNTDLKPTGTDKVLLVWDGTSRFIEQAAQFVSAIPKVRVSVIHPLPHEAIHAYGTVGQDFAEPTRIEKSIGNKFQRIANNWSVLKSAGFQIQYGERIEEIVRLASVIKAKFILIPRFEQSRFSLWIHGNLNVRLVEKAPCKIIFLNDIVLKKAPEKPNEHSGKRQHHPVFRRIRESESANDSDGSTNSPK